MTPRENLLVELFSDLSEHGVIRPDLLWQIGLLVIAVGLALVGSHYLKPRLHSGHSRWKWGSEGLARVVFPLLALVGLLMGGLILAPFYPLPHKLLAIAVVLFTAMVNIRVLVYVLRSTFNNAQWLIRSEKYIAGIIWTLYALHVVGLLPEIVEALNSVSFKIGKINISLLGVINGLFSVALTLLVAMWLSRLIEQRLMGASLMDMNLRVVLAKLTRTFLVTLAVIVALPLVGIDPTVLSVFGGALGVGLGFGLQKIASNYVSGFIILLDRSVKLGDLIQIDARQGVITGLTSRYVVLKGADGTESLVPNETLITSTVVNQSYNDRSVWIKLPISVAYESDLQLVMKLLVDATRDIERIVQDPPPRAYLENFGASAVDLSVGFWVKDPENGTLALKSQINERLWLAFREHRINIPFNRLDVVHFRPNERLAGDGNLQGLGPDQPG
ncbi:mechanosensitive ion channel family protein [Chitiniphilus shinanonensis]|uniref:mechanosensitive ion channel family protein n=1 Tax=Chitiniphilus shinanonensis TaxID=553088 RepID=UPI00305BCB55